jgi:hypothetical protein
MVLVGILLISQISFSAYKMEIYHEIHKAIDLYVDINHVQLGSVLNFINADPEGIREYVLIINWAFDTKGIDCNDTIATELVKSLNEVESLRFEFGFKFSCDNNFLSQGIRQPIRVEVID